MDYENKFGPRKKSGLADVFHAIFLIGKGRCGRETLAREVGLNTGSVRSLVLFLKREKIIRTTKGGMVLAHKGKGISERIASRVLGDARLNNRLTSKKSGYCLQIRKRIDAGKILQLRDMGIMRGAGGMTFLLARRHKFIIPYLNTKEYSKDLQRLNKIFAKTGSVIIAFGGENPKRAAWHIATQVCRLSLD